MTLHPTRKRRLWLITSLILGLSIATGLILYALQQNINVFVTPSELGKMTPSDTAQIRLGGVVKRGSLIHHAHDLGLQFIVTDFQHEVIVHYHGVLPDLFKEGKGVITEGKLTTTHDFIASRVLAKHDENYRPTLHSSQMREHA